MSPCTQHIRLHDTCLHWDKWKQYNYDLRACWEYWLRVLEVSSMLQYLYLCISPSVRESTRSWQPLANAAAWQVVLEATVKVLSMLCTRSRQPEAAPLAATAWSCPDGTRFKLGMCWMEQSIGSGSFADQLHTTGSYCPMLRDAILIIWKRR